MSIAPLRVAVPVPAFTVSPTLDIPSVTPPVRLIALFVVVRVFVVPFPVRVSSPV